MQHYTTAALPPHRSAGACLALGNLLTRGSSLLQNDVISTEPVEADPKEARRGSESGDTVTAKTATARMRDFIFRSPPTSPPNTVDSGKQPSRRVTVGWGIPREGNKAVRDVEGMGVAGGWLVLGLGWLVEEELARGVEHCPRSAEETPTSTPKEEDDLVVKPRSRTKADTRSSSRQNSISDHQSSVELSHGSSDMTESSMVKTPHEDDRISYTHGLVSHGRSEYDQLKLFVSSTLCSKLIPVRSHVPTCRAVPSWSNSSA
jgi:hypothetical protein